MVSPSPIPHPKSPIPRESFSKAIEALLQWINSQPKHQKSQLFEPDDVLYLILTLARVPANGRTNPFRIPIPHALHPFDSQSTSICIILDDRPNSPFPPSTALEQVRSRNLPISFVIGLSDLKSDYQPYESRRKLGDSYDLFFADRKILPLLPRLLGKHFFKRKKIPLAVDFGRAGWADQIKGWCESSLLYLRTGTCCGLKIGRVGMGKDEILDNAETVLERAMEIVPKKWGNLRSVHVKTVDSVALPVYQKVPEIGMRIEGPEDEKAVILKKEKKRARDGEEKTGKKANKERIRDVGYLVREEVAAGDEEVVNEEVAAGDEEVVNEEVAAGDEEVVNEEVPVEEKAKKEKNKKRKKSLASKGEQGGLMMNDDVANAAEEEGNDELELKGKGKRKKKESKVGKSMDVKESGDEEVGGEQSELSEKKLKKKKKKTKETTVVPSQAVKTSKHKRNGDKFIEEEVGDELGLKGKKKKVKKGGNPNEDAGEVNGESDLSQNNKDVEEDAVVASDGKKSKLKKSKGNVVKKSKRGKVRTATD